MTGRFALWRESMVVARRWRAWSRRADRLATAVLADLGQDSR